jgi:hypothetical protein
MNELSLNNTDRNKDDHKPVKPKPENKLNRMIYLQNNEFALYLILVAYFLTS